MIEAVNSAFRRQAFRQGSEGDVSAASVYLEIVRAIAGKKKTVPSEDAGEIDFEALLRSLKEETESYISHGLLSNYPFDEIIKLYHASTKARKNRIKEALGPFITSIKRRIAALNDVHSLMMTFEGEINEYLSNKSATVHALDGILIKSSDNILSLDQLSSGEKQLLFLLAAAVVSRGSRSLILIDEPELSLNYKWQRRIAKSLATLSSPRSTQFIMATHSIEIITQFAGSAFELTNEHSQANA
jgi:predicted ATP-dependent endonuclease of OLD family